IAARRKQQCQGDGVRFRQEKKAAVSVTSGAREEAVRGQCAGGLRAFSISRLGGRRGGPIRRKIASCVWCFKFSKAPQCWPAITLAAGGPQEMQNGRPERQLQWKLPTD